MMGEPKYFLRYMCAGTHEPVQWSAVRSDRLPETCKKCNTLVEPFQVSPVDEAPDVT